MQLVRCGEIFLGLTIATLVACQKPSRDDEGDDEKTGNIASLPESLSPDRWTPLPLRSAPQRDAGFAGGEGMQIVYGLEYAPSNPSVVYLSSDTSQVWKSRDGGKSWEMKHRGFLANGGLSLKVDPQDEMRVLVAGFLHESGSDPDADGIYLTVDGGENWRLVHKTPYYGVDDAKGGTYFAFAGDAVYAGTHDDGLLKSVDGGETWSAMGVLKDSWILDVKVAKDHQTDLFVATKSGLYKLDRESGKNATRLDLKTTDFPRAVQVAPDGQTLYVTTGLGGVLKSTDGGSAFEACNTGLDLVGEKKTTYLAMSAADSKKLFVSFYETSALHPYVTNDACNTWQPPEVLDAGDLIAPVNDNPGGEYWGTPIAPHPLDSNIVLTSANGNHLERSTDGGLRYTFSGDGYSGGRAGSFSFDPGNSQRFVLFLTDFGVVYTEDGGSSFRNLKVGDSAAIGALEPVTGSKVIIAAARSASGDREKITVTHDLGETWTRIDKTLDEYTFLGFHPQNTSIAYAGKFKTTDKGMTWAELERPVKAIFQGNGDTIYSFETDEPAGVTRVYKSSDAGASWSTLDDSIPSIDVRALAVSPASEDALIATALWTGIYIWNGSTWEERDDTHGLARDRFGTLSAEAVAFDPVAPNTIYVGRWIAFKGHANGVFRSRDGGQTWEDISFNLGPEFTTWGLGINPHNGHVFLGSSHGTFILRGR